MSERDRRGWFAWVDDVGRGGSFQYVRKSAPFYFFLSSLYLVCLCVFVFLARAKLSTLTSQ